MRYSHLLAFALLALLPLAAKQDRSASSGGAMRGDVQHGRYLVEDVAKCIECHTPRDQLGILVEPSQLLGAPIPVGPPPWAGEWALRAPRIRGLPGYDDEKARRLLTEGSIGRDGKRLRPPMPAFRMSVQDAVDVIEFLRSSE